MPDMPMHPVFTNTAIDKSITRQMTLSSVVGLGISEN